MNKTNWTTTPIPCGECGEEFLRHQYNQTKCIFCLRESDPRFTLEKLLKNCAGCGAAFVRRSPNQQYCTDDCRSKNAYLLRVYGINRTQYNAMVEEQDGKCAICLGTNFRMRNSHTGELVVDHDHDTGRVRGLLCHKCNQGIGLLQESEENLERALAYIQEGATTIPQGSRE